MRLEKFVTLKPGEHVIAVIREDVVPYIGWILLVFVWIAVPFFLMFPLFREGALGVAIFLLLLLSGVIVGARKWYAWQRTVFVITDRRIIDIAQHGFFERIVSEVALEDVEDVAFRIKGAAATMFRYGLLTVQTAGNAADLEFRRVRRPAHFHNLIHDLREEAKAAVPADSKARKVADLVSELSDEEVNRLTERVRARKQKKAMKEFFSEERE